MLFDVLKINQFRKLLMNYLNFNLLSKSGIPQRIPSPRELQYHTQSIMQNALIRKKLEEQRENYRKRQEQEQKAQQEQKIKQKDNHDKDDKKLNEMQENNNIADMKNSSQNQSENSNQMEMMENLQKIPLESPKHKDSSRMSPSKYHNPPPQILAREHAVASPIIFTPTSVLRKMTAEKESDNLIKTQPKNQEDKKRNEDKKNINVLQQLQQQQILNQLSQIESQLHPRMITNDEKNRNMMQQQQQQQQQMSQLFNTQPPQTQQPPPNQFKQQLKPQGSFY